MRTVTLKTLLGAMAALHNGQTLAQVNAASLPVYAECLNAALRYSWNWMEWPELCVTRQRSPESGLVTWQESGQVMMGTVLAVTLDDPGTTQNPRGVEWRHDTNGAGVRVFCATGDVFVRYLPAAPEVTTTAWASGTTYSTGALAYDDASGDCYESLADANLNQSVTDATKWRRVLLPWIFRMAVPRGAHAIRTGSPSGQPQTETLLKRSMDELLAMEAEQFRSRAGQVQRFSVLT